MEIKVLYEGKIIKELREYIYEFNFEFNEPNTYYLFFEDGSEITVNKSTAEKLLNELQKQKNKSLVQDAINKCMKGCVEKSFDRTIAAAPNQNIKKVNVLGTEYEVELLDEQDETMKAMNCDGYTDYSIKSIKVLKNKKDDDVTKQKDIIKYQNNILRHELIHAFLYECGIDSGMQFHNEECVDFFAMQFNKLSKIFEDAGCLDDGKDLDSFKETLKKYHRVE